MDIVYILGTGSQWDNNEIRYSLRSLKNLPHRKVFVIGEKCDWFSDKIIHIPAKDPYQDKLKNAIHKLRIACRDERVSDDFILMNDDFYVLEKLDEVKYFHKGTLEQSIKNHPTKNGKYYDTIVRTKELLNGGYDYSMHYPFIYNKVKLLKILKEVSAYGNQWLLRTIYGNRNNVGGDERKDVKIKTAQGLRYFLENETDVMSSDDKIVLSSSFQNYINNKFPDICRYERLCYND